MDCEKVLQAALNEMENNQFEEAAKHFDLVVVESGVHPEASFFRAYCKCHVGTLGDIPNQTVLFTNAFSAYVDSIKKMENTDEKEEKMKVAVDKLSELISYFTSNSSRTFLSPTIGMSITHAAKIMADNCAKIIQDSGIKVDSSALNNVNASSKSNKKMMFVLIGIGVVAALAFIIYEVITWSSIAKI